MIRVRLLGWGLPSNIRRSDLRRRRERRFRWVGPKVGYSVSKSDREPISMQVSGYERRRLEADVAGGTTAIHHIEQEALPTGDSHRG
jgi:hypothetical protein